MEKVFVTGGDGLLGSNLVRELLSRNYGVTVLIQKGRETGTLEGLDISKVEGDLLNQASMTSVIDGHDYVIHVAASTSIWPSRNEMVNKVNIEGTRNVIEAAKSANVKRFVHVGTANTFGFGSMENPGKEGNPYAGSKYGLDYMDSKYKAHQVVMEYVKNGFPAVVVNPTFMIGPYDSAPSSGAMIVAIYKGQVPGYSPGGRNYVYVKDAATALANALTMGRVGESYILGNKNMNYKTAFGLIANVLGKKAPKLSMPKPLIVVYGFFGGLFGKWFGYAPKVTYPMALIACDKHYFTAQKAIDELKLPQTPLEDAVKECYDWLNDNGYLK